MKHQLRNLIIALISILGLTYIYRVQRRKEGPLVRVLCFHDVADGVWFESVISMIKENFNLITPEEFKGKIFSPNKINVLLTFDDGYQTWIDNCLPVLVKYQAKGIFFINSGLVDLAEDQPRVDSYMRERLLVTPKRALSWIGAKQLLDRGQTLGGHTISHFDLASLDQELYMKQILEDKRTIELRLGINIADFAYPFGKRKNWNESIQKALLQAGYKNIYTTGSGFSKMNTPQEIARVCLEKGQSMVNIRRWVRGGYDIFNAFR